LISLEQAFRLALVEHVFNLPRHEPNAMAQ
jgi:hypothetical protein